MDKCDDLEKIVHAAGKNGVRIKCRNNWYTVEGPGFDIKGPNLSVCLALVSQRRPPTNQRWGWWRIK